MGQTGVLGISGASGDRCKCNKGGALHVTTVHSFSSFADDYAGAQTGETIITPTSGKKLELVGFYVSTKSDTVDVSLIGSSSSDVFFKLYTSKKQSQTGSPCHHILATDETLDLTCGAGTFVCITYDEID